MIFDYPTFVDHRRHGPSGYKEFESYRPWLRDEFSFRCRYCLIRETWTQFVREFEIDHLIPITQGPEKSTSYDNLVYSCARCNSVKSTQTVSDPAFVLVSNDVKIGDDGIVEGTSRAAKLLILQMDLNSELSIRWRRLMIRCEQLIVNDPPELRRLLLGFPTDLPDLSRLRPRRNSRPLGTHDSWFELRARGELPEYF